MAGAAKTEEEEVEDPYRHRFQNAEINLGPPLWEELLFAFPHKFICSETCKGLCPQCGTNLNTACCDCGEPPQPDAPESHKGLAQLADMFPELNDQASED